MASTTDAENGTDTTSSGNASTAEQRRKGYTPPKGKPTPARSERNIEAIAKARRTQLQWLAVVLGLIIVIGLLIAFGGDGGPAGNNLPTGQLG